jgi:hypothetical protein
MHLSTSKIWQKICAYFFHACIYIQGFIELFDWRHSLLKIFIYLGIKMINYRMITE